jgi:hypothetical protein
MKSLRFIALKLAALSEKDRRWLLAQLPQVERDHLRPELDRALTLSTPQLLKALNESASEGTTSKTADKSRFPGLNEASKEQLAAVLGPLPLACTALLLDAGPWPASEALETSLSTDERQHLPKVLSALRDRISPQFEELMLDQISKTVLKRMNASNTAPSSAFEKILDI